MSVASLYSKKTTKKLESLREFLTYTEQEQFIYLGEMVKNLNWLLTDKNIKIEEIDNGRKEKFF